MATNGVVSVTQNGKTVVKAVAGCSGMRAKALADSIRERHQRGEQLTAALVDRCAFTLGFGCPRCLVVMDEQEALGAVGELPPLYRQTFSDPRFNPRWRHGTAAHVEVVEIGDGGGIRTRFISQKRYDLLKRLIEQYTRKRLDEEGELPALYASPRLFWKGRAYLVSDAGEWIEPIFRKRVRYRPVPKASEGEA